MNSGWYLRRCASTRGHSAAKRRIVRARRHRDVELGAARGARARFVLGAGARIQEAAVLVDVGEDQVGVALEGVVHAVAVMRVDVHVSNALQAVIPPQHFHGHAAVVEHAETGGRAARGVMQTGDRNEGAARLARHDLLGGEQRRADHVGRRLVDAAPRRRVAGVEESLAGQRRFRDQVDVLRRVERLELVARGGARLHDAHALVEAARGELREKCRVAIGAERMAVAETVAREALAGDHQNGCGTDDARS